MCKYLTITHYFAIINELPKIMSIGNMNTTISTY